MSTSVLADDLDLGPGSTVQPFCVLGCDPVGADPLVVGPSATFRSHTVVYRGSTIGARFHAGHGVLIREHTTIGDDVSIGSHTVVEHHVELGDGVRLHSGCFVPEFSVLEPGAWLGPGVLVTNARYPNRPDTKDRLEGVRVGRDAAIGAGAVLLPGIRIGAGALIGAGAVVVHDVDDGATVVGNPRETDPMSVPFLDLARLHASIRDEIDAAVDRVITTSAFVGGPEVAEFESAFGAAHDLPRGVGCASGTDALALALRALGVGPGDEVIVPSMTFVATAEAVVHVGATPVLADVDAGTLLLDEAVVAAARTPRTRAVIPVHLYGHVVPPELIEAWRSDGLVVVEDAAQAHLATFDGRPVGSAGHAVCFSFYPGKNLGALGDGGMVLSSDPEVLDRARMLANHGRTSKYLHDEIGWCSRLDGLQAAILGAKLRHLASWTDARRALADHYDKVMPDGLLVPWQAGAVHHLLVVRVADRDAVVSALGAEGIGTGVHYPVAMSDQPWLAALGGPSTPIAERAADEVLSLPMDPLMTTAEIEQVAAAVERAVSVAG